MSSENDVANQIGSMGYYDSVYVFSTGLFYGLALPVFALSISVLRPRARSSKLTKRLLIFTYLTLLTTTGQAIANVGDTLTILSFSQNLADTSPLADRLSRAAMKAQPYGIASLCFQVLNFLAGDAIVVWRASVLWGKSRLVRGALWLLLAGSAGVSLYDFINFAIVITRSNGQSANGFLRVDAASMFVSFGVNAVATASIIVKAWQYRRSNRITLTGRSIRKKLPFRILLLLVECGLLYCAAQLANGVLTLASNGKSTFPVAPSVYGRAVLSQFTEIFAGTYSALVISIITIRRSTIDDSTVVFDPSSPKPFGDMERGSSPRSPMRFAPVEQTMSQTFFEGTTMNEGQSTSQAKREM